jgi:glutamate synthase domain-containing protein 3
MCTTSEHIKNVIIKDSKAVINAEELHYQQLNMLLRKLSVRGVKTIEIYNVYGQRYIGTGLKGTLDIKIHGIPGNDLGAFMNGQRIFLHGNAQDGCGNTMDDGLIVVYGSVGDIAGYAMRGGKIFVRDDAGFRVGVHMKEYGDKKPVIVIGGKTGDFLGEYMAGGIILVLNLKGEEHTMKFIGVGMHGGVIYIRGEARYIGKEAKIADINEDDLHLIEKLLKEFSEQFNPNMDLRKIMESKFTKIVPLSHRPYGKLYG